MVVHNVDTADTIRLADDTESDLRVSDIVEFLQARLDEDEAIARTSIGKRPERAEWSYEPWTPRVEGSGEVIAPNDRDSSGYPEFITCDREGVLQSIEERDGPHLARHDPARVLREVEAKRAAIAAFDWAGTSRGSIARHHILNGVIRPMAAIYSDHPDYREEWATDR